MERHKSFPPILCHPAGRTVQQAVCRGQRAGGPPAGAALSGAGGGAGGGRAAGGRAAGCPGGASGAVQPAGEESAAGC